MSNLHATGIGAPTRQFSRVDQLQTGQRILYEGLTYIVCETLPVEETSRWAVIATGPAGRRTMLPYPHRTAIAELVVG